VIAQRAMLTSLGRRSVFDDVSHHSTPTRRFHEPFIGPRCQRPVSPVHSAAMTNFNPEITPLGRRQ